jgi:HD-GYP domain-containing protein (c-di-GMP phosphodiesterase class II)
VQGGEPAELTIRDLSQPMAELSMMRDVRSGLMASGDGVELILHRLAKGSRFGMIPADGWNAFEAFVVLEGELRLVSDGDRRIAQGQVVSAWPVRRPHIFEATVDSRVLYLSSQPVFESASDQAHKLRRLAHEVELKDGYTHRHCQRVQNLALRLGRACGLAPERLHWLMYGAYLHDVGKSRLPGAILGKNGPLTAQEWALMRTHPDEGKALVDGTFLAPAGPIIAQHHERWDGSGYPRGLAAEQILFEAQVVAVVDTFDAITTDRPYHRAESPDRALAELRRCSGRLFRSDVVEAFCALDLSPPDEDVAPTSEI